MLCGFGASELRRQVACKDMQVVEMGIEDVASRCFGQRNAEVLGVMELEECGVVEDGDVYSALVGTIEMDESVGIMRHLAAKGCEAVGIFNFVETDDRRMACIGYDASDLFGFVVEARVGPAPCAIGRVFDIGIEAVGLGIEEVLNIIGHDCCL